MQFNMLERATFKFYFQFYNTAGVAGPYWHTSMVLFETDNAHLTAC